jgi:hypothetical protein
MCQEFATTLIYTTAKVQQSSAPASGSGIFSAQKNQAFTASN